MSVTMTLNRYNDADLITAKSLIGLNWSENYNNYDLDINLSLNKLIWREKFIIITVNINGYLSINWLQINLLVLIYLMVNYQKCFKGLDDFVIWVFL